MWLCYCIWFYSDKAFGVCDSLVSVSNADVSKWLCAYNLGYFGRIPVSLSLWIIAYTEYSNDYQQIACKTQNWCNDYSSCRENVGIEWLLITSRARHKDIANGNKCACNYEDVTRGYGEETGGVILAGIVWYSVHIAWYIDDRFRFFQILLP